MSFYALIFCIKTHFGGQRYILACGKGVVAPLNKRKKLHYLSDAPRTNHRVYGLRCNAYPTTKKHPLGMLFCGGQRWIRTTEVEDVRFTV